ncbi:hypothetical protein J5289_19465 [Rhizobium sp. B230/85]|nr:hypothetical protein [Rhizobium sp. L58/93]MBO9136591.1 hypothetical protein [Rhizobium sp. B209b/85]MBO9172348.1 hypothetical protein [Rhizobium sp. L245/93]MBO9188099.1 hypothetical protein [Rhizobium sp. E27B/91]QXZ86073.1 hypothetical protein J5287_23500 [Rhizobium sp. K1/93]QXZ92469.1 hypothetical protein J5280_25690 [Rhizobium sp. K15/93]QXZ98723.1 hypothetical protein J5289_19465 [Rhizobium sp. B230/85]QYA04311.1 hypothetical protein J5278_19045 [Rhizobium sp. B21/90]
MSNNLVVPANISILPLPAKSPELNPVGNLWLFMRENWLSNQIIRRHCRSLLRCLAKARNPAVAHNVNWAQRMGKWVLVSEDAYNPHSRSDRSCLRNCISSRRSTNRYWPQVCMASWLFE